MTTPMIVLSLLFLPLIASWLSSRARKLHLGGTIGVALAFAFFGTGHYVETEAMTQMLPPFVPFATTLVFATGVLELVIAGALLHPASRRLAGFAAIAVLIGFFPANIYAALNYTGMGGHAWGPVYLLVRVPLQGLLVWWVWYFVVQSGGSTNLKPAVEGIQVH